MEDKKYAYISMIGIDGPNLKQTIPTNIEHTIAAVAWFIPVCIQRHNEPFGIQNEAVRTGENHSKHLLRTENGKD